MPRIIKRHILLLEVLIALALVALCAFPLLAPQMMMIRSEREFLHDIEADRVANTIFVNIVQKMYSNSITWQQLNSPEEFPIDSNLLNEMSLPRGWPYAMTCRFKIGNQKPVGKPAQFALVEVWITMTPKEGNPLTFFYEVFVEKEPELISEETNEEE